MLHTLSRVKPGCGTVPRAGRQSAPQRYSASTCAGSFISDSLIFTLRAAWLNHRP
jgi:hypothetical protein